MLPRIPFVKPALDVDAQLDLLKKRGMTVPDEERAKHYLRFIGYFRLSGYWFPFQYRDGTANHDDFRGDVSFEVVLERYVFDRRLRVLIMDAVERIEVSVRAVISDTMCGYAGPHWYLDSANFSRIFDHSGFMRTLRRDAGIAPTNHQRQTDFIRHYLERHYEPELPPSWMVFEVLSFGSVSLIFKNLPRDQQREISDHFGLPWGRLQSWLHAVSTLRNLCTHHSRVWNREFGVRPSVARSDSRHVIAPSRFYNHAVAIQTLLKRVSGDTHWADRLRDLLDDYPNIPRRPMGFPDDWDSNAIWA